MKGFLCVFALAALPVLAQIPPAVTCNITSAPQLVRVNGASELAGDVLFTCTGGTAGLSTYFNFTVFLNVDLTSKIMSTVTNLTEALLLIDDPAPGVTNTSNGCSYSGQVLGTPGISACMSGSGNVYQGEHSADNLVTFPGVPFVEPGPNATRMIRVTNLRANAANIGTPGANIMALVSMSGPNPIMVTEPGSGVPVATMETGMLVTSALAGPGRVDVTMKEGFPSAFKKRIENTTGGPLTTVFQDQPGQVYCTESGFIPQFGSTAAGSLGSADTGTRLLVELKSLPPASFLLVAPNEIVSSSGALVAHRVYPPFTATYTGGTIPLIAGDGVAFITGHSAKLLYEVTANSPYQSVNGCQVLESFTLPVTSFFPVSLASATVSAQFAPVDGTPTASATAARPRFLP